MKVWTRTSICFSASLMALCGSAFIIPSPSEAYQTSIAYFPDGRRLATTTSDGVLQIWSADGKELLKSIHVLNDPLNGVAIAPDGKRLAAARSTNNGEVWDTGSWTQLDYLFGHNGPALDVAFSPDGKRIATASADKTVRLWDTESGREIAVLQGHTSRVKKITFSRDGTMLASAADDPTARIWDVATGQPVATFNLPDARDFAKAVAFAHNSCCLVVSGRSKAYAWDIKSRKLKYELSTALEAGLAVSPDGKSIIGAGQHAVFLYDATTGELQSRYSPGGIEGPDGKYPHEFGVILGFALSADGQSFALISPRNEIHVATVAEIDAQFCIGARFQDAMKAIDACTRLIAQGEAVAAVKRADYYVRRGQMKEMFLSIKSPDKSVQEKILADYDAAIRLDQSRPSAYLARGVLTVSMGGDSKRAITDLSEVIRLDPGNSRAYHVRGMQYAKQGDLDRALADLTKAIELAPDSVAYQSRGEIYEKKDRLEAAFADFDAAVSRSPKNSLTADVLKEKRDRVGRSLAKVIADKGQLAAQNGDVDLAILDFNAALDYDPKNWRANFGRGEIYLQRADLEKAEADIKTAIQQFSRTKPAEQPPEIATAHVLLGEIYEKRNHFRDALLEYDEALKAEQNLPDAESVRRGFERVKEAAWKACADSGRRNASWACGNFVVIGEHAPAARRAHAFLKLGQYDQLDGTGDARVRFDHAIRLDDQQPLAFFGRAQSRAIRGELDLAVADFSQSIRLDPKFAPAFYGRGLVHEKQGDLDHALEDLTQAINLGNLTEAYALRAEIYERKGDASRARADLAAAEEANKSPANHIDPDEPFACLAQAQFAAARGKFVEAGQWFYEAHRRDPKDALAYLGQGSIYAKQDQIDNALRELSRAIDFGGLAAAHALRGQLYEKKGDLQRALADYDAAMAGDGGVPDAQGVRARADRIRSQVK